MKIFVKNIIFMLALIVLTSCSGNKVKQIDYEERDLADIYNTALDKLIDEEYEDASIEFDEVERQHPYSKWSKKSILMSSYASYKDADYIKTEANLKRFLNLYPASELAVYAQYLLGMSYYQQIVDTERDQTAVNLAYEKFKLILDRYPSTEYAKDAYYKKIFLEDSLAAKEMNVGKTYLSLKKYIAAVRRFKNVVNTYQTSSYIPEALYRLTELYLILGIKEEALINARVLGYNYPNSKWYKLGYKLLKKNKVNIVFQNND